MTKSYSQSELAALLKEVVVTKLRIPEERLVPEASLKEDLDLDSIDMFDILAYLEEKTGRKLDGDAFRSVKTVQNFLERLQSSMNGAAS
jgi:acyl carrier protein